MRKLFKKIVCLGLAAMLALPLTACGKGEKDQNTGEVTDTTKDQGDTENSDANEVKEFNVFAGISTMSPDNSEKTLVKEMNEKMGVTINWNCIAGDDALTERKNVLFATAVDLPDALMGAKLSDYELNTYGGQGLLIPLNNYINEETMPNLMKLIAKRPQLLSTCTMPDGNIYGLPGIGEMGFENSDGNTYYIGAITQFTSINKEWLDNLGLAVPTTIDELHDVLVAFRDEDANGNGDKNDEIPLSFMYNNWCAGMTTLFSAFGFTDYNDQHRVVEDGVVKFNAARDEYKEAMAYFHKWYEEGLIDLEVFSQEASQYIAKGQNTDAILGCFTWWEIPEVVGYDRAASYTYLPFLTDSEGNSGVNLNDQGTTGHGSFSVTNTCKNPELLLKWIDQLYDPLNSMQAIYGPIGEFFAETPDSKGVYTTRELAENETEGDLKAKLELWGPVAQLSEDYGTYYYMEARAQQRLDDLRDFWFKNVSNYEYYPSVTFTVEETEIINDKISDIKQYVSETGARWLTDGGVEEEWDDYVKQLDAMGLQDVIKCWQDAYDRYMTVK